ncbi:hypothetical protein D9757_001725 [Collybiopsis confluens]|uniref:Uncharacterized protein n=1 Tax=Collybiopsis confluens TaxID=2823264 RepID=A0A8H5HYN1_9AGAR|nr:hypothetical protein D9757_001725 [Collybiopsis confluens]
MPVETDQQIRIPVIPVTMILDEKTLLSPPPPYFEDIDDRSETTSILAIGSNNPYAAYISARQSPKPRPIFTSLPSHLLLQIVYCTFPQEDGEFDGDLKAVLQRRTLHWLETSLRLVSCELYIVAMNVLRSIYLSTYDSLVQPPYSSDPFPSTSLIPLLQSKKASPYGSSTTLFPQHRELKTLDQFIAILAYEELLYDTSSLHLSRHEAYKDMFELMQPRSRLEDLVGELGMRAGLISLQAEPSAPHTTDMKEKEKEHAASSSGSSLSLHALPPIPKPLKRSRSTFSIFSAFSKGKGKGKAAEVVPQRIDQRRTSITPIPFECLKISFSTRKVGLMYAPTPPPPSSQSSLTVTGSTTTAYGGSTYGALGVSHHSRGAKRTIVEVEREREESLEKSAETLIRGLRDYLVQGA